MTSSASNTGQPQSAASCAAPRHGTGWRSRTADEGLSSWRPGTVKHVRYRVHLQREAERQRCFAPCGGANANRAASICGVLHILGSAT